MIEQFSSLIADGTLLVMWGALLFHVLLPIPYQAHPMTLWQKFASQLAEKINGKGDYSQRLLYGTLAWLLMWAPALLVLIAASPLVWDQRLFELALLLLALDWRSSEKLAKGLVNSLGNNDKQQARAQLAFHVNRQTDTLSPLGLGKAGAETLLLGYSRNVIAVLFWFGLTGGIGAFMYRLTCELSRAWSPSREELRPFGLPAVYMLAVFDYLPLRLFALLLCTGHNGKQAITTMWQQGKQWQLPGPGWLLAAVGGKLELSLGGPAIYLQQKLMRPKLGGRIAPAAYHLAQLNRLLNIRIAIWIAIQSLIILLFQQGL